MMAAKNLLGGFENGMGADLKQQLLDEEEKRALQLKTARKPDTGYGGSANNMASMALLGAGGSYGG